MANRDGPIRIAFLGADDATPALLRIVCDDRRFELIGICEPPDAPSDLAGLGPMAGKIRPIREWEALLDDERVDAVIVARGADEDRRAEQLRKFIQTGMPILVSQPVVGSMLIYYELDMIRRETLSVVVPHLPLRNHPAVRALAEMVRAAGASPIGKVEHVTMERCVAEPTKPNVERQFARDVDLVRGIAGELTRLGAMAGGGGENAYASLGVQMSGPGAIAARWSVVPIHSAQGAKITLAGGRGRAVLEVGADDAPWTLEVAADGQSQARKFAAWSAAEASLDELAAALAGAAPEPDWVDACRSIELTETIERSLQKSRTVELYYEDYTEEGTFKGTMTSIGCGLLLLGLLLMPLMGVAEQMHVPLVRYWPYALAGLFGVFLLLQLVMLTSGKKPDKPPE